LQVADDAAEAVELIRRTEADVTGLRQEEMDALLVKEEAERLASGDRLMGI
jgi:hypothetical protein